jgi:hypothetical protein
MSFNHRNRVGSSVLLGALLLSAAAWAQSADALAVRVRTEHYAIAGTVTDARLAEYSRALEFIHAEYEKGFARLLKPEADAAEKPARKKSARGSAKAKRAGSAAESPSGDNDAKPHADEALHRVVIFSNTNEYEREMQRHLAVSAEHTIGMFIPSRKLLAIADQGNSRDTYEVLFHEAFHQFMHKHLPNPPMWLNEGLAVYFGSGVPTGKGIAFTNVPTDRWKLAREAIDARKSIPLHEVVAASRAQFYDRTPVKIDDFEGVTRSSLFYSQSYTLLHMLQSDPEGRKRLQSYIRELADADGRASREITQKFFDEKTCRGLESHWARHVKAGARNN